MGIARYLPRTLVVPVALIALVATCRRKPGEVVLGLVAARLAGAVLAVAVPPARREPVSELSRQS